MRFSQNDQCMRVKPPTEKFPVWKVCYHSSLWQNHLVHMHRVRVRRCRCCWCRVALWTGYTGSHLPVILSAWHLHLYSSLFVPAVDLLDATSSVRGTELWHVTLICLAVFDAMYNSAVLVTIFIILTFFTLYNSCPCLSFAPWRQRRCLYTTYLEQSAALTEVQYVMVIWTTLGESCAPMNYCTWQHCAVSLSLFGHE